MNPGPSSAAEGATVTTNYDPITAEVISMAMQSIVGEMGITVERTSGSPGATDAKDYSCVLARADGGTIAYYGNNLQHLGDSRTGTEAIIREFPVADIREGDVFIYRRPVLHRSAAPSGRRDPDTGLSRVTTRRVGVYEYPHGRYRRDVGLGIHAESRDVYSEGLRMPPTRIVVGGVDNVSVWTTIKANVRTPVVMGDIRSAIAANNVGKMRFLQTCDETRAGRGRPVPRGQREAGRRGPSQPHPADPARNLQNVGTGSSTTLSRRSSTCRSTASWKCGTTAR